MTAKTAKELQAAQDKTQTANGATNNKIMNGARALVEVGGTIVGCFDSCTWTSSISTESCHVLGRYSSLEIIPTAYEQVDVNCSGFRSIGTGPNEVKGGGFPMLNTLISLESITIQIIDRATDSTGNATGGAGAAGALMMTVVGCVPTSYSSGVQAKSASRFQISYRGTRADYTSDAGDSETSNAVASLI